MKNVTTALILASSTLLGALSFDAAAIPLVLGRPQAGPGGQTTVYPVVQTAAPTSVQPAVAGNSEPMSNAIASLSLYSGLFNDSGSRLPVFSFLTRRFAPHASGLLPDRLAADPVVNAIPEPGTLTLLGLGAVGMLVRRRKRA